MWSPPRRSSKRYRPHVPLDKRKRAVRACISCRDGKKKCILTSENQCQNCTRVGQVCIFETKSKRQPHTHSHGSRKHDNLTWRAAEVDVSQSLQGYSEINLDSEQLSIVAKLFQDAVRRNEHSLCLTSGSDSPCGVSSCSYRQITRPGAVMEARPYCPSATAVVDDMPSASHASFLAAISDTISPMQPKGQDSTINLDSFPQEEFAPLITVLSQLPPYQDAQVLVDVFFTFVESNWYYFDEIWFRNLLTEVYMSKAGAPQRKQCTSICLVFLVLALGRTFEHLFRPTKLFVTDKGIPGGTLFAQATKFIPRIIAAGSVESAICCLLTSLYLLATEDIPHHHMYLGLALNLAVGLSLHRTGMRNDETPQAHEAKVRLFWTIYSIERQTSVIMGLPTMLQLKDITVSFPQRQHDLDANSSQRVDRLLAFTKLTIVMDELINAGPIEQCSTTYDWAFCKLESLKQLVPAQLLLAKESSFRADAHLSIMYNMIWVNIGRGPTLRLVRSRLYPAGSNPKDFEYDEVFLRSQKLAEICAQSATNVINWIVELHSRKLLARLSFTDFHTCSSAVIVLLMNVLLQSSHEQMLAITRGIEALRFLADGSKLAMNALLLVERLQEGIHQTSKLIDSNAVPRQQSLSLETLPSQSSSQGGTLDMASNISYIAAPNGITCDTTTPGTAHVGLDFLGDLGPSLLEYSEQYLALFGFAGFESMFDSNFSM